MHPFLIRTSRLAAFAAVGFIPVFGLAQDESKKAAPGEKPAEKAAADPASSAGPAQQAYQAKFTHWKNLLQKLRKLKTDYQTAATAELPAIEKKWNDLMKQGDAMLPGIRDSALAAYKESPNTDRNLVKFLFKIMEDMMARDDYSASLAIAMALDENNSGFDESLRIAAVAAFSSNNFDLAETYFGRAEQAGVLSGQALEIRDTVSEYKDLWKVESELREKEAKANDLPRVKITTTKGDVVIELFENEAPDTVGNFVNLVEKGFYDGVPFHRVLSGFMAQGGCPVGDGSGGPGYKIYCECRKPEHRKHFSGSLSMAKTAARDTGGSQFFITYRPTPHLNGKHTVFGRVLEGMEHVTDLVRRTPETKEGDLPDKILKAVVIRKRDHEYKPNPVQ